MFSALKGTCCQPRAMPWGPGNDLVFGPERDVLSAQGHALGTGQRSGFRTCLDRSIPTMATRITVPSVRSPGHGPGLTERPFQGRNRSELVGDEFATTELT